MVLTPEQLTELTGYRWPSKQVEWLRNELGINPPVGPDGRPRVSQAVVDQATLARMTGQTATTPAKNAGAGPNWTVAA